MAVAAAGHEAGNLGMHGYLPEHPEMRSSFFMVGPQVPKENPWAKWICGRVRRRSRAYCTYGSPARN